MLGTDGRFYDPLYDYDRNGQLDIDEKVRRDGVVYGYGKKKSSSYDSDSFEDDLFYMDEDERREALEAEGYDSDDYDENIDYGSSYSSREQYRRSTSHSQSSANVSEGIGILIKLLLCIFCPPIGIILLFMRW